MSICRATILVSWGKPHGWKLWSCTDSSSLKPLSLTLPLLCWNCLEKSFFYRPPFTLWLHISSTRLFPRQVNAKLFLETALKAWALCFTCGSSLSTSPRFHVIHCYAKTLIKNECDQSIFTGFEVGAENGYVMISMIYLWETISG